MVRIYGISAEQLDVIRSLVADAEEYESGLYVVKLWEHVHVLFIWRRRDQRRTNDSNARYARLRKTFIS